MTDEKKLKIEFMPGAFDHFDGTQEELDEMVNEITAMLSELTPEELSARSRTLEVEDLEQMMEDDPALAEALIKQLTQSDNPRNLQ